MQLRQLTSPQHVQARSGCSGPPGRGFCPVRPALRLQHRALPHWSLQQLGRPRGILRPVPWLRIWLQLPLRVLSMLLLSGKADPTTLTTATNSDLNLVSTIFHLSPRFPSNSIHILALDLENKGYIL
ncbi:hypothetical protein B566_EDAN015571 [Ephemera danica]|nr:hypothetical protein B566_EDAN015571 [Ephemera danica]